MMSRVPQITIEVRPGDIEILINAARKAIDMGKIGTEGEEFNIEAAIGAVNRALEKGRQEAA
jgi:hypothetical protein